MAGGSGSVREVLNQAVIELLLACRRDGMGEFPGLFAGLPFDERSLARRPLGRVDWEPFSLLLDRVAEARGGPPGMLALGRRTFHDHPLSDLLRLLVGPRHLYRLVLGSISPWLWPALRMGHAFLAGDRLRVEAELPAVARGSLPFWYVVEGSMSSLPTLLGLPDAVAEPLERTPHRLLLALRLPPARTIRSRLQPDEALIRSLELQWSERQAELRTRLGELEASVPAPARPRPSEAARVLWRLTAREEEVVALVLEGLSNREIAERLGCHRGTVEAHLSHVFQKARVGGRVELMGRLLRTEG